MRGGRLLSRYWLLVPLILVAIVAREWVERPDTFEIEETVDMRRSEADYYLEDFRTRRFDASGALEYVVSGDSLSHFPDEDVSDVVAPRIELRRADVRWQAEAENGRFETDPDVFTLLGDVRLERVVTALPAGDTVAESSSPDGQSHDPVFGGPVTITTRDLALALDTDEVSTDAPFEIVAPGWRLAGTGLRSTIDAGKLELLSNVNGTYDAAVPP